jgi:hypothetical protein
LGIVFLLALILPSTSSAAISPRYTTSFNVVDGFEQAAPSTTVYKQEVYQGSMFEVTLQGMLTQLGVTLYPEDTVKLFPEPSLGLGSTITITRAPLLTIVDANRTYQVRSWVKNIQELDLERRLEITPKDQVIASGGSLEALSDGTKVIITRVAEVEITKTEQIAYSTIKKETADLEKGQTSVVVAGVNGTKEVTYLVKRVNGVEASRKAIATKVTKPAVVQEVLVGIGPKLTKVGPHKDLLNAAAKKYLINATALHCLMMKESRGNATSVGAGGTYKGLFQYTDGFWASASAAAGYAGASIYNPEAQIFATARAITKGQSGRWPPWSSCSQL